MTGEPEGGQEGPAYRMVEHLPDLIQPEEYDRHPEGRLVRIRIEAGPDGVRVTGDAFRPEVIDALFQGLGPDEIQQMLCG
ncbi:radical SAM-modified peptide, FtsH ternary system-associated [Kitasatospora sp. NPDC047058]|uniref:radical SAM-modified peptide, FtsH ternary system-associated n=1 Tax=Kitasatospora sp. NPDC047058 TaxID=3155620 RepID=UPI0034032B9A